MEQSLVMEQREGCAARKAGGENMCLTFTWTPHDETHTTIINMRMVH